MGPRTAQPYLVVGTGCCRSPSESAARVKSRTGYNGRLHVPDAPAFPAVKFTIAAELNGAAPQRSPTSIHLYPTLQSCQSTQFARLIVSCPSLLRGGCPRRPQLPHGIQGKRPGNPAHRFL